VGKARLTDSTGGTATGTRTVFGNVDALFFTVSGATSGTVFTVSGLASTRGDANGSLDIAGITFDSTPEPTTLGGCAGAALALIWFGRRRRKPSRCVVIKSPGKGLRGMVGGVLGKMRL
jgi:hypothetical protein